MQKRGALILLACLALLAAGFSGTATNTLAPNQASDVVFKTPEEAITSYMEGVAQADLSKILQASAVNETSEKFRFDLYVDWVKVFLPSYLAPTNYPFYVELNKAQLTSQILGQVRLLIYSLLSSEDVANGGPIKMDLKAAGTFIKDVDTKRLAQLEVKKIGVPNKTLMDGDPYRQSAAKHALVYGADESTERVALFSFEQNYYYVGFTLLRYGDSWKIIDQISAVANASYHTDSLGAAQKTTIDEFNKMTNGN